jgi:hypothetical protein
MKASTLTSLRPRGASRLSDEVGFIEFTEAQVAKAERAVAKIVKSHDGQLNDEIDALVAAWRNARADFADDKLLACHRLAHDLAGHGETLGFPLVTVLARSLRRFLRLGDWSAPQARAITDAHVDALCAIVRTSIKGDGGTVGRELMGGLERLIDKTLAQKI